MADHMAVGLYYRIIEYHDNRGIMILWKWYKQISKSSCNFSIIYGTVPAVVIQMVE